MRLVLATCGLLAGCAASPPADIAAIHASVRQRISYERYAAFDRRYIPPGETGTGNCMVHAFTAYMDLKKAGYSPEIRYCWTPSGERHALTVADGWVLDNRFRAPVREGEQECRESEAPARP